jgi:hypothetical protein
MYRTVMRLIEEAALHHLRRADLLKSTASPDSVKLFTESRRDIRDLVDRIAADRVNKLELLVREEARWGRA